MHGIHATRGPVDLVLHGGGVKAIGLIGALSALEDRGYRPRQVAGSSAGAIVAGLLAAGYTASEMRAIMETEDVPDFLDRRWYARLPAIGRPLALLWRLGFHAGDVLQARLEELLHARGVRTFGDLDPGRGVRPLQVVTSDITSRRLVVFPQDAWLFGLDPDSFDVALALRISASIPIIYEPIRLKNSAGNCQHLLVDGGMLSNFPLWIFDDRGDSDVPVLGLRLVDDRPADSLAKRLPVPVLARTRIGQLIDYVESLARTMMEAHDRRYLDDGEFVRTISIPTSGISSTQFDLSPEQKAILFQTGYEAVAPSLSSANDPLESMVG